MDSLTKKQVITFGEVMMRLSPPGRATFSQANNLDLTFGGGESNVAISLAYFGIDTVHVTRFPDNFIGRAATQFLRHHWVDTSHVIYGDERMGKYFLEKGSTHRPSQIVYEREGSAFAEIQPDMVDWEEVLNGADWFHWTGITPGVSKGAADCCQQAIEVANDLGITVSGDIHSRSSLWKYGKDQAEVLPSLIEGTDIVFASEFGINRILNFTNDKHELEFKSASERLMDAFPRVKKVVDKDRTSVSASHNRIQGKVWNGKQLIRTSEYDITPIIERVGTGDAFAAGWIYGQLNLTDDEESLKFATAACSLKHTVEGDANVVSVENVMNLVGGDTSGRINR